jgi:hypothetical protein
VALISCAEFVVVVDTEIDALFFAVVDFYFLTTVETPIDGFF